MLCCTHSLLTSSPNLIFQLEHKFDVPRAVTVTDISRGLQKAPGSHKDWSHFLNSVVLRRSEGFGQFVRLPLNWMIPPWPKSFDLQHKPSEIEKQHFEKYNDLACISSKYANTANFLNCEPNLIPSPPNFGWQLTSGQQTEPWAVDQKFQTRYGIFVNTDQILIHQNPKS